MLNTVVNFTIQSRNVRPDPEPILIAFYATLFVIIESLGNFLLFCMVTYEKYGMDPQKRTLTNQLLSKMILVQILFNIFIMPLYTLDQIFTFQSKYRLSSRKNGNFSAFDMKIWKKLNILLESNQYKNVDVQLFSTTDSPP